MLFISDFANKTGGIGESIQANVLILPGEPEAVLVHSLSLFRAIETNLVRVVDVKKPNFLSLVVGKR